MKQLLLICAVVALVGCGFNSPNEAANELFVEAVELISRADETTGQSAIDLYEQGLGKLEEIITKHSKSDLAVKLISGETLFTNRSLKEIRDKVNELKRQVAESKLPEVKFADSPEVKFADSIVEEEVRRVLGKPEGRLTETDVKKVTSLIFNGTQITNEGLKEVAKLQNLKDLYLEGSKITDTGLKEVTKLQNLKELYLGGNKITDEGLKGLANLKKLRLLDLWRTKVTKAGVAELKKALPKCEIFSNPYK